MAQLRLHDLRDLRVVRVRHPREEVVLDLEVEPAEHPRQHRVARAEVDGRLDLVHGPDPAVAAELVRRCERRLLDAVGELERHRHDQARDHPEADVRGEDDPPRIDEERDHDRPADEERLAREQAREIPAARDAQPALPDAPARERGEIADRLPPQPHEHVHRPDVVLLEAVPTARRLGRGEAGERSLRGVVVVPVDVRVRVVGDVVLHAPGVAREAEQGVRRPADEVIPAPALEVGAVIRVVLHAEGGQHGADDEADEASAASAGPGW